ncbi:MAG: hypothetical protein ACOCZ7_02000 [Armatimonadota bacterium]
MESDAIQQTDNGTSGEERGDDPRLRAIVPVGRRRGWRDPGPKFMAAFCYFLWLGWITAPLPLLLLNSRRMRNVRGVPYHLFAAAAWNSLIVVVRVILNAVTTLLDICEWPGAESLCHSLNMIHLVVVLSFALLLSTWYAIEALLGREVSLPWISPWARSRADHFLGRD